MKEANLNGASMINACFYNSIVQNAKMQKATLNAADFRGAYLISVKFQGSDMIGTKFQAAQLNSVQLQGSKLHSAKFHGAAINSAFFEGADLLGAEFQGANFGIVNLQGSNLRSANFQGAEMGKDVNFQASILQNTLLLGATPPMQSNVYALEIDKRQSPPNWKNILQLADDFPEGNLRNEFNSRINTAKTANTNLDTILSHLKVKSDSLHAELIPALCQFQDDDRETQQQNLLTIRGIREYVPRDERDLIDQALCKLPQCSDLLKDIGNLDCKHYANSKVLKVKP